MNGAGKKCNPEPAYCALHLRTQADHSFTKTNPLSLHSVYFQLSSLSQGTCNNVAVHFHHNPRNKRALRMQRSAMFSRLVQSVNQNVKPGFISCSRMLIAKQAKPKTKRSRWNLIGSNLFRSGSPHFFFAPSYVVLEPSSTFGKSEVALVSPKQQQQHRGETRKPRCHCHAATEIAKP